MTTLEVVLSNCLFVLGQQLISVVQQPLHLVFDVVEVSFRLHTHPHPHTHTTPTTHTHTQVKIETRQTQGRLMKSRVHTTLDSKNRKHSTATGHTTESKSRPCIFSSASSRSGDRTHGLAFRPWSNSTGPTKRGSRQSSAEH